MLVAAWAVSWVWWTSGLAVLLIGAVVAIWAVFTDRARGRRRCPRCWYDMRGIDGLTCPECGRAATHERALHRTRRRWRALALAVLLMVVATQCLDQPRRAGEGWTRGVPTLVMTLLIPRGEMAHQPLLGDGWRSRVVDIVEKRELRSWQRAVLEARMLALREDQVHSGFPRRLTLLASEPLIVRMRIPGGARSASRGRIFRLRWLGAPGVQADFNVGSVPAAAGPAAPGAMWAGAPPWMAAFSPAQHAEIHATGPRPVGEYVDRFSVELLTDEGCVIRRWRIAYPCRVVTSLEDVVPGIDSVELRQTILDRLRLEAAPHSRGMVRYRLRFAPRIDRIGDAAILRGEVLVDREFRWLVTDGEFLLAADIAPERVTLRVFSDQRTAARDWNASAAWTGELYVPLSQVRTAAP